MLEGWHRLEVRAERIASVGLPESTGDAEGTAVVVCRRVPESGVEAGGTRDGSGRRRSEREFPRQVVVDPLLRVSCVSHLAALARPAQALRSLRLHLRVQAQVHLLPRHLHLDRDQTRPEVRKAAVSV